MAKSSSSKQGAVMKAAREKSESSKLDELVHRGHALIRKGDGKEEIVATCLSKADAAAIYAVVRAFYAEVLSDDPGDDETEEVAPKDGESPDPSAAEPEEAREESRL